MASRKGYGKNSQNESIEGILKIATTIAVVIVALFFPQLLNKPTSNGTSTGWNGSGNAVAYETVNDGVPEFTDDELSTDGFIELSELDSLGRCGPAFACVGPETMATEKRGEIGSVKPTGWKSVKYPSLIKDKYLYNRCHLIGFQLSGLNAEKRNLITGTRFLNVEGMLPFESDVADYVEETGNHVAYRVTPVFQGDELVARGVKMEAKSVEDGGKGVSFNVYCPNVQPGILIDYGTGDSKTEDGGQPGTEGGGKKS